MTDGTNDSMTPKEKLAALERERDLKGPFPGYYERRVDIQMEIDAEERSAMTTDQPLDTSSRSKKPWADKYDTRQTKRGMEYQRDGKTMMTLGKDGVTLSDMDQQTIRDGAALLGDSLEPGATVSLKGQWSRDDRREALRALARHPNELQLVGGTIEDHEYFAKQQELVIAERAAAREAAEERLARPAMTVEERKRIPIPQMRM